MLNDLPTDSLKKIVTDILEEKRAHLLAIEKELRQLVPDIQRFDKEVGANIVLAFRHIEDARMRCGKAIQYMGDGVSVYDKQNS